MQKLLTFLFVFLCPLLLLGQKKSFIKINHYERIFIDAKTNISYIRKPIFQQDNAILSSDSAVYYKDRNYFEAFNNVHINQADTVNVFSDLLNYDGNSKMAHLSDNVRMIDPHSVLTTDILDYNMASKVGTYINGGKIVSKDVTLTSQNGYYFANSNDAYFRYNVVVVTPQSTIKSDTLRYNTTTKWTYFYGPTNIKGKDDNLYTENGAYNTLSQQAYFGKKNLYTQGSKSLKGDSLYYDGKAGFGKAVRNIVFKDTVDKRVLYGQLAFYYKKDERVLVTKKAYMGISADTIKVNNKSVPDTLWLGADTLETQMVYKNTLKLIPPIVVKSADELEDEKDANKEADNPKEKGTDVNAAKQDTINPKKELRDKLKKEVEVKKEVPKKVADHKIMKTEETDKKQTDTIQVKIVDTTKKNTDLKKAVKKDTAAFIGSSKNLIPKKDANIKIDSSIAIKHLDTIRKKGISKKDSLKFIGSSKILIPKKDTDLKKDTTLKLIAKPISADDTVKTRTIKAYHHVKVFKSNMQAKTDSLFFTAADSTLRCFSNPILWAEGSQITGDSIYLQLKNKKLNRVLVNRSAFLVNTPKDSLKFNQVKGKYITGFFNNGKLHSLFVDGNAESIYFTRDDSTKLYKEINQTVSSRIKCLFKNSEIDEIVYIKSTEGTITPIEKAPKESILTGFIWKPKDRPKSKEEAIGAATFKAVVKPKSAPVKPAAKVTKKVKK